MSTFTSVLVYLVVLFGPALGLSEDRAYWKKVVADELYTALNVKQNDGIAKNVILFIGDGMGPATVASARIYQKSETGKQSFEKFPHMGSIKTYSANFIVPDSASTATAIYTGVKVNSKTAGLDPSVKLGDCIASKKKETHLETILKWAQDAGKATGFVTTTRITHATPMALYAHIADRNWECDNAIPSECKDHTKDIARQLVEDLPGRNINVIMGGGLAGMTPNVTDPVDQWTCHRSDNINLIDKWVNDKKLKKVNYSVLKTNSDIANLNTDRAEYVLGLFSNGHMPYDHARDRGPNGQPSLVNMTEVALKVLQKNKQGYFLMVEGGLIDMAHHRGMARKALTEASIFENAIQLATELTKMDAKNTLIIVTADHDHSLTFTGYPKRNENILGIANYSKIDNIPFTTLNYAVGGVNNFQYEIRDGNVTRQDPSKNDTTDYEYSQQTGILSDEAIHGGSDVYVFATGPMAHLFHSVHEQPYIAHVMSYAAKIGPYSESKSGAHTDCLLSLSLIISCLTAGRYL